MGRSWQSDDDKSYYRAKEITPIYIVEFCISLARTITVTTRGVVKAVKGHTRILRDRLRFYLGITKRARTRHTIESRLNIAPLGSQRNRNSREITANEYHSVTGDDSEEGGVEEDEEPLSS